MNLLSSKLAVNLIAIILKILQTSFICCYDAIDVSQTASGYPCKEGTICTNENYSEYYCYTEDSRWERCCSSEDGCQQQEEDKNRTSCSTSKNTLDGYKSKCRNEPLTLTLSGRLCAKGSYCGYNKERFQWCWLDEEHNEWDHCCMPGVECKSHTNEDGHTFNSCTSCKDETSSCGKGCTYTQCTEREYPCNTKPLTRSVNNFHCESPCSQDRTGYAWCWVKPNQEAWDWCCFLGETCGSVLPSDQEDDYSMCYNKNAQGWPMECKVGDTAAPLPADYASPRTPLEAGAITGIVLGVTPVVLIILFLCYISCN